MTAEISILTSQKYSSDRIGFLTEKACEPVIAFHQSIPSYEKTPLVALSRQATELGVKNIFIKDESHRFGLNAFKALGATYAIAKILLKQMEEEYRTLNYKDLTSEKSVNLFKDLVFVTATDGNHGKGVAWAASIFGAKAIVYMPKGSKECRVKAIQKINDTPVIVTDLNYDETVRFAFDDTKKNGYIFVQDTGFEGYEEIPNDITQGYATMSIEAIDQLREYGIEKPTHIFLQAGVGSMAGSVLGYFTNYYDGNPPITTIVEPSTVACIAESVKHGKGKPIAVGGNPETIMAGLNCGEPNPFTWPILRDYGSFFASCPDWVTENGMRTLAHPIGDDVKVISGESGAVGFGLLTVLCSKDSLKTYKDQLSLDENSTILLFNTEGNTDAENYNNIVNK